MTILALAMTTGQASWAKSSAHPDKVLNLAFEAPDDGFDMVKTYNFYSGSVAEAIFEPLLRYDYLARPAILVPNTAESLPKVEQDGKVYTFKIKPGIYFSPDPVFQGKKRELVARDYIYSMQRIMDPTNHSPSFSFIEGKILGADQVIQQGAEVVILGCTELPIAVPEATYKGIPLIDPGLFMARALIQAVAPDRLMPLSVA